MGAGILMGWDYCKVHGHDSESVGYQNPRIKHLCPRCNRPRNTGNVKRDLIRERFLTLEASQFVRGISPAERKPVSDALSTYAERRAGGDAPWREFHQREFSIEALEEIADLRMYCLAEMMKWEMRADAGRDDEDADAELMHLRRLLAATVEAFSAISAYRQVRDS